MKVWILHMLTNIAMLAAIVTANTAAISKEVQDSNVRVHDEIDRRLKKSSSGSGSRSSKKRRSSKKSRRSSSSSSDDDDDDDDEDDNIMNITATSSSSSSSKSSSSSSSKKSRRLHGGRRQQQLDLRHQLKIELHNSTCPETNPCDCVWAGYGGTKDTDGNSLGGDIYDESSSSSEDFYTHLNERRICHHYNELPLINPSCDGKDELVPKIYHSVNGGGDLTNINATSLSADDQQQQLPHHHQIATSLSNPSYARNHHTDESAYEYIQSMCPQDVADAYKCMTAPAFRGDIFRFCALWAEGGIYLDEDIMPTVPLEELYSPCSVATVGHDFPLAGVPGKQMKILAAAPGSPIFECALNRILEHVRDRVVDLHVLDFTGPQMLHKCYKQHPEDVAITYIDAKHAVWPYTGMRAGKKVLAYELPKIKRDMQTKSSDPSDYNMYYMNNNLYHDSCAL